MDYLYTVAILVCIYAILSSSFNLILGLTGLFALSHAAFYGIGAYTAALFDLSLQLPFLVGVAAAMLIAGACSLLISVPSLRIAGDYLVIASFGFQFLVYAVFVNVKSLTKGPAGLPGIHAPEILGMRFDTPQSFLLLAAAMAFLAIAAAARISASPFGRILRGVREDEIATRALGKDVVRAKILVFTVGSMLAGGAGAVFAHHSSFISPDMFLLDESIYILAMVLVGGAGSILGSVLGALVLVVLPEALRFLDLPSVLVGQARQMLYAVVLLGFLLYRPQGLIPEWSRPVERIFARLGFSR
jgi:ABC-type branched-subunit amino acid transport system permease subunit